MKLPAAAVSKGMSVLREREPGGQRHYVVVEKVHNGTPVPGRITWDLTNGTSTEVGGAEEVEVIA